MYFFNAVQKLQYFQIINFQILNFNFTLEEFHHFTFSPKNQDRINRKANYARVYEEKGLMKVKMRKRGPPKV